MTLALGLDLGHGWTQDGQEAVARGGLRSFVGMIVEIQP